MGKLTYFKHVLYGVGLFFVSACSTNTEIDIDPNHLLLGNWTLPTYVNNTISFQRTNTTLDDSYGVTFKRSGQFIEHSSGWCGTPPLIFSDYEGNWQLEDSLITVLSQNYPGNFNWKIVSLTKNKLTVQRTLTTQEQEHQDLMALFQEIIEIVNSVQCTNISEWEYIAYGSKPCGGPQGYMAYPTTIDINKFKHKITVYNQLEDAFNKKWGIISTCDTPAKPLQIVCENGKAILKY